MLGMKVTFDCYAELNTPSRPIDVTKGIVPEYDPVYPWNGFSSTTTLLERFDSHVRPGITEREFCELSAKCASCRLYMTKRVFGEHACRNAVIDLTLDD
jgi:hypothetical protein